MGIRQRRSASDLYPNLAKCPEGLGQSTHQVLTDGLPSDHFPPQIPRSGELRTQKLKSHLVRTQSLNVLSLKPGIGQYIAIHTTLTARDFCLSCLFLPFRSIHLHFSQTSPDFTLCWLWLTYGSCVGPQNKIGHPAGCRFPC